MKVAPLIAAIRNHNKAAARANASLTAEAAVPRVEHVLVHTGQHHDAVMSDFDRTAIWVGTSRI